MIDYPLNIGGRPLNSWPVFMLVPFEVGRARRRALAGVVALPVWQRPAAACIIRSLPSRGFERASQDRFFLPSAIRGAGPSAVRRCAGWPRRRCRLQVLESEAAPA